MSIAPMDDLVGQNSYQSMLRNLGIVLSQGGAATPGNPLAGLSGAVAKYGTQQNLKDMYNKQTAPGGDPNQATYATRSDVKTWSVKPDGSFSYTFHEPNVTAPPQAQAQSTNLGARGTPGQAVAPGQVQQAQPSALSKEEISMLPSAMGGQPGQVPFRSLLPLW